MSILDIIVQSKRSQYSDDVCELQTQFAEATEIRSELASQNLFLDSLRSDGIAIIGEVKPRSPSAGKLLEMERLEPILAIYKANCAAISVLTDEEFFGGSFELLSFVKKSTNLPLLCKDFIVSKTQIAKAMVHGADAVLLIAKILSILELEALIEESRKLGLVPVVEVNDEHDLMAIAGLPVDVILINNRNLNTMEIDLSTTKRLSGSINPETIIISASGIKGRNDLKQLLPYTNKFLIGTSLMRSSDPGSFLAELISTNESPDAQPGAPETFNCSARSPGYEGFETAVKICGITTSDDAAMAVDSGADFIGIIFAESSKRRVSLENAHTICRTIRGRAQLVGVFQDQSLSQVNSIAEALDLDLIQLHGSEDPQFIANCVRPVIRSFEYRFDSSPFDLTEESEQPTLYLGDKHVSNLSEYTAARFFLFDMPKNQASTSSHSEAERRRILKRLAAVLASQDLPPFFLAGQLTVGTVSDAIEIIKPFAVDVASGVETTARQKCALLTKTFLTYAKRRSKQPLSNTDQ